MNNKTEFFKRGITLITIKIEVINEQIASDICQSNIHMNIEDTITPTLPSKSAKMCKNTPKLLTFKIRQ